LTSLSKKIDKSYSKEIHAVTSKIKIYSLNKNKNKLRDIVVEINKVIASIDDMQKDMRWE
jgi:hypothetical protein